MKIQFFYLASLLSMQFAATAQVKIGDNSTTINSASLLELETTNKGLVFPRVLLSDVSLSSPLSSGLLTGTVVYNTNASITNGNGIGLYVWNGSVWSVITPSVASAAWSLTGNAGTTASTNFIGTTDAIDFVAKTNNTERMRILGAINGSSQAGWIGMGVTPPRSSLDVTGNYSNKNVITIQNTSTTGYSSVDMLDNAGTLKGTFGYANSGTGAFFAGKDYFNIYASDFVFTTNAGIYNFFIKGSTGYIGLNTNTPSERLHLVGNFYLNGAFMPGGDAGTSGYVLTSAGAGTSPAWTKSTNFAWGTTGNSGTSSSTNFIGTTDAQSLVFKTNNAERMRLTPTGALLINTTTAAGSEVLNANGSFKLGSSGTVLTNVIKGSGNIPAFTASGVGSITTRTITITGANTGASVTVNPQSSLPAGLAIAYNYINAANTLTIGFLSTLSTINVPAITYDITITQ